MDDAHPALDDALTPREREVIEFLRLGFTNEQIGGRMGISANAVKYHVAEIISKLGVRNRPEAARWPERPPRGARRARTRGPAQRRGREWCPTPALRRSDQRGRLWLVR